MLKICIFVFFIISLVFLIFKDYLINFMDNNVIIHINETNHNYKTKPDNAGGEKFIGESLDVYEVTRERLLPRTESVEEEKKHKVGNTEIISFYIQLASYKSLKVAEEKVKEFKNSNNVNIAMFEYSIVDVDIEDRGVFYRLRVGPFKSLDKVNSVCTFFKIDKSTCIILEEFSDKI